MRDIVVIGAPVGGAAALTQVIAGLPAGFPASVFVVLNTTPGNPILLADVLNSPGRMHTSDAVDGEVFQPSRVYVAADGKHLALDGTKIRLTIDAEENNHRPSIDVLFRTASACHKDRVVAVLVLHARDGGIAGLREVRRNNGRVVTHRNEHMPASPRDPETGEDLAHDHLALEQIAPRLVTYVSSSNGNDPVDAG